MLGIKGNAFTLLGSLKTTRNGTTAPKLDISAKPASNIIKKRIFN
jgi:hypothetical protein